MFVSVCVAGFGKFLLTENVLDTVKGAKWQEEEGTHSAATNAKSRISKGLASNKFLDLTQNPWVLGGHERSSCSSIDTDYKCRRPFTSLA